MSRGTLPSRESGAGTQSSRITPAQVADVRRDLGRQLATWREAAGLTQEELARRTCYSRSAVANVEVGRQNIPRAFWQYADREVGAASVLLAAFDHVDGLVRDASRQAAYAREQERRQRAAQRLPTSAALEPVVGPVSHGCGCGVIVARWSGRETRALREAMRLTARAFAEHLGASTATVSDWEHWRTPAPSMAMQCALDRALKLADPDARTRFGMILDGLPETSPGSETGTAAGGFTVTPFRRPHGHASVRGVSPGEWQR